jgi:c-di-GMP-binding flagellar brake protein YcgR
MENGIAADKEREKGSGKKEASVAINDLLQVTAPGDRTTHYSRINNVSDGRIAIAWPTNRGIRMPLHSGQNVEFFFMRQGIPYGFNGSIVEIISEPLPQILVQLDGPVLKLQRRQNFRVKCLVPVEITGTIQVGDGQSREISIKTATFDLSAGGLAIRHPISLPENSLLNVKVGLPDGSPEIKITGRIAYSDTVPGNSSLYHIGIYYHAISEWERARIIRYLYRIQLKGVRA